MERLVLWHRTLPPPFEEGDSGAPLAEWASHVATGVQQAGGEILSSLAGTVVGAFDVRQLESVVHLALRLLSEAERQHVPTGGLPIAFGVATGEVKTTFDAQGRRASTGSAIDRAQLLANQAKAGEVVLDVESREAASRTFLFDRAASTSEFALRGEAIDRQRPLRKDCRENVRDLQAPGVPEGVESALTPLRSAAVKNETRTFRLLGPAGIETRQAVLQLASTLHPPLWLELGPVPGGLEPLGSLRLALLRQWSSPEELKHSVSQVDLAASQALEAIASANPPPRDRAVRALRILFRIHTTQQGVPWLYLERVLAIDRATLSLFDEVLQDERVAALVAIRTLENDAHIQCFASLKSDTLQLPTLSPREATHIAAKVLGEPPQSEIAHRVALSGGNTTRGIVEAARTIVAAGDLVRDGSRFTWRRGPKGGSPVHTSTLIEERLGALEEDPLRALEILCAALPASCAEVIEAAMDADGLTAERGAAAVQSLQHERFATTELRPDSEELRRVVIQRMPAGRRAEVYRFVGQALAHQEPHNGPALMGTIGAYLCEGGNIDQGVRALLQAGVTAASQGYTRAAVRLAAVAVQFQPDQGTRSAASRISRATSTEQAAHTQLEDDPEAAIAPTEPPVSSGESLLDAFRAGHHDRFDDMIESAIAEGANLTTANCLRAVSYACRGDLRAAGRALDDARRYAENDTSTTARLCLTGLLLLLARGRVDDAALQSLDALACAKESEDTLGRAASLKTLALCYRTAEKPAEAQQLELAAARSVTSVRPVPLPDHA